MRSSPGTPLWPSSSRPSAVTPRRSTVRGLPAALRSQGSHSTSGAQPYLHPRLHLKPHVGGDPRDGQGQGWPDHQYLAGRGAARQCGPPGLCRLEVRRAQHRQVGGTSPSTAFGSTPSTPAWSFRRPDRSSRPTCSFRWRAPRSPTKRKMMLFPRSDEASYSTGAEFVIDRDLIMGLPFA